LVSHIETFILLIFKKTIGKEKWVEWEHKIGIPIYQISS